MKQKPITSRKLPIRPGVILESYKKNNLAIRKGWSILSSIKEWYYLKNEINVYRFLGKISKKKIYIPVLYKYINKLIFVETFMEFIDGESPKDFITRKKINTFIQVLKFTNHVTKVTRKHKTGLKNNSLKKIRVKGLFVYLMSIIKNPSIANELTDLYINSIHICKPTPINRPSVFTHKDLSDSNVIVKNSKIYLIDFGITEFNDKIIDPSTILFLHINDTYFTDGFVSSPYIKKYLTSIDRDLLKRYMYLLLIYDYATGVKHSAKELRYTKSAIDKIQL